MDFIADNIINLISLIVLLFISAFFSGSETALFSLSPTELNRIRKSGTLTSSAVITLHNQLPEFLLTVLFGNMVINILFFSISGIMTISVEEHWGAAGAATFGILALFMVILCGEVTPKTIASASSYHCSLISATPMLILHKGLTPIRYILRGILNIVERIINFRPDDEETDEELKLLFELGQSKGDISRDENGLLTAIIDLPQIKAGEIMTPRVDIISIPEDSSREYVINTASTCRHSKILLWNKEADEYTGWIDAREVFFNLADDIAITSMKRRLLILSEFDRGDQILSRFMETRYGLGLVVDERGCAIGIMALSDLAGEIFGELGDEDSRPVDLINNAGPGSYTIDGSLSIREWKGLFNIDHSYPGVSTMGGLVPALLGRPARIGDYITINNQTIRVLELRKRRPGKLSIDISNEEGPVC